jgi:hypothetical protein
MASTSTSPRKEVVDFIDGSMERQEFRFPRILDWIQENTGKHTTAPGAGNR